MSQQRKTVVVAMSGGVDSSVAAALLQEAGHRVVGAFRHRNGDWWLHNLAEWTELEVRGGRGSRPRGAARRLWQQWW